MAEKITRIKKKEEILREISRPKYKTEYLKKIEKINTLPITKIGQQLQQQTQLSLKGFTNKMRAVDLIKRK